MHYVPSVSSFPKALWKLAVRRVAFYALPASHRAFTPSGQTFPHRFVEKPIFRTFYRPQNRSGRISQYMRPSLPYRLGAFSHKSAFSPI